MGFDACDREVWACMRVFIVTHDEVHILHQLRILSNQENYLPEGFFSIRGGVVRTPLRHMHPPSEANVRLSQRCVHLAMTLSGFNLLRYLPYRRKLAVL